jgi:aminoglycoside phosphotransferase family enzyme
VLLPGEVAYKIKRPVRLPFVAAHPGAARIPVPVELRLNQRFAAGLYFEVCRISAQAEGPRSTAPTT